MPRSHYSNDSGEYVPILVGAPRPDPRRRSPDEGANNNFYLNIPNARPRAASTSGNPQPINLTFSPSVYDDSRSRSRSRSRHRHRRRSSSSSGDRSRRSYHRNRDYEYESLPYDLRRELDFAREARAEEQSRSQERRRQREQQKWADDYEDRKKKEQREQEKWADDYEDRKKKEQREKERIIQEAKDAEEKRKKEEEALRKKILDEEEEKKKKKKKEKELEDKLFEEKVREKFKAAGYSDAHIDEVLHRKREKHASSDREWAIDLSRPTFIKVNRKYLSPTTLDHFGLPWEWDMHNNEYIIIKKYIDHDFQDQLFEHTKTLKEKKLITSGYEKEVKVTLKPADVYKEKDQMYLVRTKSKSPGRSRRSSWMFT